LLAMFPQKFECIGISCDVRTPEGFVRHGPLESPLPLIRMEVKEAEASHLLWFRNRIGRYGLVRRIGSLSVIVLIDVQKPRAEMAGTG